MPARNESWALGLTLRAALLWADSAVVLDHASTDATPDIISDVSREHPGRVQAMRVEGEWDEPLHRQMMLDAARERGATLIAIIDADELLTGNLLPVIRPRLEALGPGQLIRLPWVCCWRGIDRWRTDGLWGRARAFAAFADAQGIGWRNVGRKFHQRYPWGVRFVEWGTHAGGGMFHLQFADWRRVKLKHDWYRMREVIDHPHRTADEINRQYAASLDETGLTTAPTLDEWWAPYRQWMKHLDLTQTPWHAAEIGRLLAVHVRERFAGLDI